MIHSFCTWNCVIGPVLPGLASSMAGTPSCSEQRLYGTCTAQDGLQGVALKRPDGACGCGCGHFWLWGCRIKMEVSKNRGTPKITICLNTFGRIFYKPSIWGTPQFMETPLIWPQKLIFHKLGQLLNSQHGTSIFLEFSGLNQVEWQCTHRRNSAEILMSPIMSEWKIT